MSDQRTMMPDASSGSRVPLILRIFMASVLLLSLLPARAADVYYTNSAATNRQIIMTPMWLLSNTNQSVLYDRVSGTTDTNGYFMKSNCPAGVWRVQVLAPPDLTKFDILVPTNNGPALMDMIMIAMPKSVTRPQDYSYSASASDLRYQIPGGNVLTNAQAGASLGELTVSDSLSISRDEGPSLYLRQTGNMETAAAVGMLSMVPAGTNAYMLISPNVLVGGDLNVRSNLYITNGNIVAGSKLAPKARMEADTGNVVASNFWKPSNVSFWGAAGTNGDDTVSISNCIAATKAAGGGTVQFPAGRFVITSPLDFSSSDIAPIALQGASSASQYSNSTVLVFQLGSTTNAGCIDLRGAHAGFELSHLEIRSSTNTLPLVFIGAKEAYIHDCYFAFSGTRGDAIVAGGTNLAEDGTVATAFTGYKTTIERCVFYWCARALLGQSWANGITFANNHYSHGSGVAVRFTIPSQSDAGNLIEGNVFEADGPTTYFVEISRGFGNGIIGNGFYDAYGDTNFIAAIHYTGGSLFNCDVGNFYDLATTGKPMVIDDADSNVILDGGPDSRIPNPLVVGNANYDAAGVGSPQLTVRSWYGAGLTLDNKKADAPAVKSWSIQTDKIEYGDLAITQGRTNNVSPITSGTNRLWITAAGEVTIPVMKYVNTPGSVTNESAWFTNGASLAWQNVPNNAQFGLGAGYYGSASYTNSVAVGNTAMKYGFGVNNTAYGIAALYNSVGDNNSAFGFAALNSASGSRNVAFGASALETTTGSDNTAFGFAAGLLNTNGSGNVYLGAAAGPGSQGGESNKLYIANAAGTPLIGGDFAANTVTVHGSLTAADGYWIPTNGPATWPPSARIGGEAYVGSSNGVLYLLMSAPGSTAWTKTNLWFAP